MGEHVEKLKSELAARMMELKPAVDEYRQLEQALHALNRRAPGRKPAKSTKK